MTTSMRNSIKLNATQLVLLSAASQRRVHLMVRPETISPRAFTRAANALLKNGLLAKTGPDADQPDGVGRADQSLSLAITPAGLTAIGVTPEPEPASRDWEQTSRKSGSQPSNTQPEDASIQARPGSKRAQIIALLSRRAALDDLIAATGWLPHTTRAALTGLRHKGYHLDRTKGENGGPVYRILSSSAGSAPTASRSEIA